MSYPEDDSVVDPLLAYKANARTTLVARKGVGKANSAINQILQMNIMEVWLLQFSQVVLEVNDIFKEE